MDINIKPVKVFGKPDGTILKCFARQFEVGAKTAVFKWSVFAPIMGEVERLDEQQNPVLNEENNPVFDNVVVDLELVAENEIEVPENIFSAWGADDNIIFDYIINQIGVKRA